MLKIGLGILEMRHFLYFSFEVSKASVTGKSFSSGHRHLASRSGLDHTLQMALLCNVQNSVLEKIQCIIM